MRARAPSLLGAPRARIYDRPPCPRKPLSRRSRLDLGARPGGASRPASRHPPSSSGSSRSAPCPRRRAPSTWPPRTTTRTWVERRYRGVLQAALRDTRSRARAGRRSSRRAASRPGQAPRERLDHLRPVTAARSDHTFERFVIGVRQPPRPRRRPGGRGAARARRTTRCSCMAHPGSARRTCWARSSTTCAASARS